MSHEFLWSRARQWSQFKSPQSTLWYLNLWFATLLFFHNFPCSEFYSSGPGPAQCVQTTCQCCSSPPLETLQKQFLDNFGNLCFGPSKTSKPWLQNADLYWKLSLQKVLKIQFLKHSVAKKHVWKDTTTKMGRQQKWLKKIPADGSYRETEPRKNPS